MMSKCQQKIRKDENTSSRFISIQFHPLFCASTPNLFCPPLIPIPNLQAQAAIWVVEPMKEYMSKIRKNKINRNEIPFRPIKYVIFQLLQKNTHLV
jgi:hypothetical protein